MRVKARSYLLLLIAGIAEMDQRSRGLKSAFEKCKGVDGAALRAYCGIVQSEMCVGNPGTPDRAEDAGAEKGGLSSIEIRSRWIGQFLNTINASGFSDVEHEFSDFKHET